MFNVAEFRTADSRPFQSRTVMEKKSCNMQQYGRLVLRNLHCYVIGIWSVHVPWVGVYFAGIVVTVRCPILYMYIGRIYLLHKSCLSNIHLLRLKVPIYFLCN